MGDRCFVRIQTNVVSAKVIGEEVGREWQVYDDGWEALFEVEGGGDGLESELMEAARRGAVFIGYSAQRHVYPATLFASNGIRFHSHPANQDAMLVVEWSKDDEALTKNLEHAKRFWAKHEYAKRLMRPDGLDQFPVSANRFLPKQEATR